MINYCAWKNCNWFLWVVTLIFVGISDILIIQKTIKKPVPYIYRITVLKNVKKLIQIIMQSLFAPFSCITLLERKGQIQPKVAGREACREGTLRIIESTCIKGVKKEWPPVWENLLVFLLNNVFTCMFALHLIETVEKEKPWVKKRGGLLVKKGAPSGAFNVKGGNCSHLRTLNPSLLQVN